MRVASKFIVIIRKYSVSSINFHLNVKMPDKAPASRSNVQGNYSCLDIPFRRIIDIPVHGENFIAKITTELCDREIYRHSTAIHYPEISHVLLIF